MSYSQKTTTLTNKEFGLFRICLYHCGMNQFNINDIVRFDKSDIPWVVTSVFFDDDINKYAITPVDADPFDVSTPQLVVYEDNLKKFLEY